MRASPMFLAGFLWLVLSPQAGRTTTLGDQGAVIRLRLPNGGRETLGTAVLVARQARSNGVVLHFLTSARLIGQERGVQTVSVSDRSSDIGVLHLLVDHSSAAPQPILYDAPKPGEAFAIVGFDAAERLAAVSERVSLVSPERVVGDRRPSALVGCVGAPAVFEGGIFGVVTDCDPERPPTIALLSAARRFLTQQIPSLGGWGS